MITIRLVSQDGKAPPSKLEARFAEAGGDIGRGSDCSIVLADPGRRISRRHLHVSCRGGQAFFLRLLSTNLLVELDGNPMPPQVDCAIGAGTRIRVGPFELLVEEVAAARAPAQLPLPSATAEDSMLLLRPQAAAASVFHDLLQPAAPLPSPRPESAPPGQPLQEVDLLVGEPTGAQSRHVDGVPAPADAGDADALIAALFSGLGIAAPAASERPSTAQAELLGALLRQCISGALGLLAARAIAKRELGAVATQIQVRENNPLKFAPTVDVALALLLSPPRRGFVPPQEAVRDAFDDLRAHEVALLAGMRAALTAVLDRFDPAALEARLADPGLWDTLLPSSRRARLWERYGEQHEAIAREIEEHFDAIFAGAFTKAYEAQRQKLAAPG